ncbi:MAG: glycosyltransferase, partial [Candidatus Lokiarchaeota archaeon]|nr:glycosyltransferase [Candidatus Lokiarchaeota archaeon]
MTYFPCLLYKLIKKERPHIVHTHTAKAGALGRIAAKLNRVPIIIHTFHGHAFVGYFPGWITRFFIFIERRLTGISDAVIAISSSQVHDLCEKFKVVPRNKMKMIPLGIDFENFSVTSTIQLKKRLGLSDDSILAAVIGRMVPIKNIQMAIQVVKELKTRGIILYLLLVGDGEEKDKLNSLV